MLSQYCGKQLYDDEVVMRRGRWCDGIILKTATSPDAIASAGSTMPVPLHCCCLCCHCLVLIVFVAIWRHCCCLASWLPSLPFTIVAIVALVAIIAIALLPLSLLPLSPLLSHSLSLPPLSLPLPPPYNLVECCVNCLPPPLGKFLPSPSTPLPSPLSLFLLPSLSSSSLPLPLLSANASCLPQSSLCQQHASHPQMQELLQPLIHQQRRCCHLWLFASLWLIVMSMHWHQCPPLIVAAAVIVAITS
jgi:hypothetical protein